MTQANIARAVINDVKRDTTAREVAVTQETWVSGSIEEVFDFVAAEDVLPEILTGYGLVPAVAFTSNVSGPWDQPGSDRIVHLADGSTVREGLTHFQRASYFAYRVSNPSFSLKHLMVEARGEFWFEERDGGVHVKWTYTFVAKNRFAKLPLTLFVKTQWNGFMEVCMVNIGRHFGGK
ncbi:MAG: SRPBCC family protein [Sphingomonas sp.]|nr:MAG: SRPBCC family protein [Sphingomonas sp.]